MKRYALFAGDNYYPSGGWNDLIDTFDIEEEIYEYVKGAGFDWFHIVDLQTGKRI